jgi:hypothetical protein
MLTVSITLICMLTASITLGIAVIFKVEIQS